MALRIGIAGIQGRMGGEIAALAVRDANLDLVGGLSRTPDPARYPGLRVVQHAADLLPAIDALIDFSGPEAAPSLAAACVEAGTPWRIGGPPSATVMRCVASAACPHASLARQVRSST